MLHLIRKRHEGDGWILFSELGNKPGYPSRRADAFALGVWASNKFEGHLYEEKQSREDLKKELRDPTKMDGPGSVGQYATYRWLVVADEKITEGLVIPDAWGILTPTKRGGSEILKVLRKAPKLEAKQFNAQFVVSMVRNALRTFVTKADHERVCNELAELRAGKVNQPRREEDEDWIDKCTRLTQENLQLKQSIEKFEEASGVEIGRGYEATQHGRAFKAVLAMAEHGEPLHLIQRHISYLSEVAAEYERRTKHTAEAAVKLRALLQPTEHTEQCSRRSEWSALRQGRCTCGLVPITDAERAASDLHAIVQVDGQESGSDEGEGAGEPGRQVQ